MGSARARPGRRGVTSKRNAIVLQNPVPAMGVPAMGEFAVWLDGRAAARIAEHVD